MYNRITIPLFILIMFFTAASNAQKTSGKLMQWKVIAELPSSDVKAKAPGLAGPVTGVTGNKLIIAGGANFPDGMPWTGGKKKYHNQIYVLQPGGKDKYEWIQPATATLPLNLAYSGNITLPDGIVCIGGETDSGYTSDVLLLKWDESKKDIVITSLPALPVALANAAVANIGRHIYVAGGENANAAMNDFFRLNLDIPKRGWEVLPSLPFAMSHAVALAQSNGTATGIFVIGGRRKSQTSLSTLYKTVLFFDPSVGKWKEVSKINDGKKEIALSAASAVSFGEHSIMVIGGDEGVIFHQIENFNLGIAAATTDEERAKLQDQKVKLLLDHPGFSRKVLLYNTVENKWSGLGELPMMCPLTTTAIYWKEQICIPGGEIQPGRRTPEILMGSFKKRRDSSGK